MAQIYLRPQNFGTPYDVVPNIEGIVYNIEVGEPLTKIVTNYLENKKAVGFYLLSKVGFGDVYIQNATNEQFEIVRENDIKMSIVIY